MINCIMSYSMSNTIMQVYQHHEPSCEKINNNSQEHITP